MKRAILIAIFVAAALTWSSAGAQSRLSAGSSAAGVSSEAAAPRRAVSRDISHYEIVLDPKGDTTAIGIHLNRVYCFSRPIDMSRHRRLVRDFRVVYPLAQVARTTMSGFEEQLLALPNRKAQRAFSKQTERSLVSQYTPTLRRMTISQGRILLRLIDRETDQTSYEIVREFRGGFVAGFWQGVARIFGHNLKDEYDPAERDRLIERCILMYNAGLLPEY